LTDLGYAVGTLLVVFGLFLFVAGRAVNRGVRSPGARREAVDEHELIRGRLASGQPPPLADDPASTIGVFVSGHTHAPSLTEFERQDGGRGALVNSGCWLRQLQPVPARFGAPPVFVSRFVQTHVRVYLQNGSIQVELWEHPRRAAQRMRLAERLAVVGRVPDGPLEDASPRVL
jgi:hypothetical protein